MPRQKSSPLPDMTIHNLRKRAEQMQVIARAIENGSARASLEARAADLAREAEAVERTQAQLRRGPSGAPESSQR